MFCAHISPIILQNLTKTEADNLCKKLNREEIDDYVHYTIEKLNNPENNSVISEIDPYGEEEWV